MSVSFKQFAFTTLPTSHVFIGNPAHCTVFNVIPSLPFMHRWRLVPWKQTRIQLKCSGESIIPDSPNVLVQSWERSRSIASSIDLSRRFVSVLFLSNNCQRAAFAEKQFAKSAEKYAVSRRLLILSAGIYSQPGDLLPSSLILAANAYSIDLSEERPCASFGITDCTFVAFPYNFFPRSLAALPLR